MKNLYSLLVSVLLIAMLPFQSHAQLWSELDIIFQQLNPEEQEIFLNQLENLEQSWDFGSVELNSIVDSLNAGLDVLDPTAPIDSMLNAWDAGSDSLSIMIGNSNLDIIDSLAIMEEYNEVNEIWELNLDSLGNVLDEYSHGTEYPEGWLDDAVLRFEVFEGLWTQTFNELQESLIEGLDNTEPVGLDSMPEFLDTLFSSMFDFELAYGQQTASVNFWGERYEVQAMQIRVGSVPRFDNALEARWHVQASYFSNSDLTLDETSSLQNGLNALRYDGNFSLMFNPVIGSIGQNGRIRLYSSLGMEVGTYVPPHVDLSRSETFDRVGKTTGWGPQVGAGFVITTGNIHIYSYGTYAQGRVYNSPDYRYISTGARAGIRYGDIVNVSYQFTRSTWAPNDGKLFDGYSVSIGLILSELMN